MRAFRKIEFLVLQALHLFKWSVPLFKRVVVADKQNWIGVNWVKIYHELLFSRVALKNAAYSEPFDISHLKIDGDFKTLVYKGVHLFKVSEYNICVDLEIFPDQVSPEDEDHRRTIERWFFRSAACVDFFERIIRKSKPAGFLISQGHNYDSSVVRNLCCLHDKKVVAVENTFNKGKIVWDNVSGISVNKNLAKNYYWKFRDCTDISLAEKYVDQYLKNIKGVKSTDHATPIKIATASEKKTVLFLGQVFSDSSILFGINHFDTPVEIIERLVDYCIERGFHLIIKLHPKEATGKDILGRPYDNLTWRKIAAVKGLLGKILESGFVLDKNEFDTYALMELANVCVTVNSQAGLEALIKGKPVVACGHAYYTGLGFTYDAFDETILKFSLDHVLNNDQTLLDNNELKKFFYILSEKYFFEKSNRSISKLLTIF